MFLPVAAAEVPAFPDMLKEAANDCSLQVTLSIVVFPAEPLHTSFLSLLCLLQIPDPQNFECNIINCSFIPRSLGGFMM